MGTNIRIVIDNGDQTGTAVCICGRNFDWSLVDGSRINVLYKVGSDRRLYSVICCPRCLSMLKT